MGPDWASRATTQCPECADSCSTVEALTTETNEPGVSLALGLYDGETFTPSVPPPQLAVQVSCRLCLNGQAGFYLAGELDEDGNPQIFTKGGDVFPKWRIVNSGSCGWTIEADFEGEGWNYIGVTYKDYYKEDCDECKGPCLTDEALTTDELYNVENGEPWSDRAEVALVRGYYDGETFVAA